MGDTPHLHSQQHSHHDCRRCCSQDQEGCCQAQGPRCPPPLRQHDQGCHQGSRRQEGFLPPGHPGVRLRQLQGGRCQGRQPCEDCSQEAGRLQGDCRCCCRWKEGRWILQAPRQGAQGEARQGQEGSQGQEAKGCPQEEGCQKDSS